MNVLELFAGSRSIGKAAEELGFNVFSSDVEAFPGIDYQTDILSFDVSKVPFKPDIVWASPPCEKWSLACGVKGGNIYWETIKKGGKAVGIKPRENFDVRACYKILKDPEEVRRQRELHSSLVDKTLAIIAALSPRFWFIENPLGLLRFYLAGRVPYVNLCTYCQYGYPYRKPTNIFSNIPLVLKTCKQGAGCHSNNFYTRGKENTLREKSSVSGYYERSRIPHDLCLAILKTGEE